MMPIGLMFIDSKLQYGFKDLVDCFYLFIRLRIVGGGEIVGEV
jgi:hypothetical protein